MIFNEEKFRAQIVDTIKRLTHTITSQAKILAHPGAPSYREDQMVKTQCPLCKGADKTSMHVLKDCPVTRIV